MSHERTSTALGGRRRISRRDSRADGLVDLRDGRRRRGDVLMVAHMNAEALDKTLETGVVHYWSRSRRSLWRKGDTSGQIQSLVELRVDCDQDALLARVQVGGDGGACHTGPSLVFLSSRRGRRRPDCGLAFVEDRT